MQQSVLGIADYKCMGPYSPNFATKTPGKKLLQNK